jgi:hypothetical protein
VGYTALGTVAGGLIGGLAGYVIGVISLVTFAILYGIGMVGSGGSAMLATTYVTVGGAQLVGAAAIGGTIAGTYYLYIKRDIKEVNQAAKEARIPNEYRGDFRDFIHKEKRSLGKGASENFKYQDLLDLAYDFLKQIAKKIRR